MHIKVVSLIMILFLHFMEYHYLMHFSYFYRLFYSSNPCYVNRKPINDYKYSLCSIYEKQVLSFPQHLNLQPYRKKIFHCFPWTSSIGSAPLSIFVYISSIPNRLPSRCGFQFTKSHHYLRFLIHCWLTDSEMIESDGYLIFNKKHILVVLPAKKNGS